VSRIRLRYVNAFANRNRKNERVRYYFRRRGQKAIPLPGLPGSDEFMAAYAAALNMVPEPVEVGVSRTLPGTINALCVSYYRSIEWSQLNATTQAKRKRVIERFREQHGTKRVATLQPAHIEMMLNKIETAAARRYWWTQIKPLLKFSVPMFRKDDPTLDIARIRIKSKGGHHCWSDDEVAQYRAHWPLGSKQRLVLELALETTSRRSEIVRLGPQHVRDGRIRIDRIHGSRPVDIPLTPELKAALDAMAPTHLTYLTTSDGKPRSPHGLAVDFAKWCDAAGLLSRCRLHGLKKAGMRRLAEAGATGHELMAVSGHKTLSMVQHYTAAADRTRLADSAMAKRNTNAVYTNTRAPLHKHVKKP
jgi:integrase